MRVLVPMADGFEEIEFVTVVDILRRAGMDVQTAGISPGPISGSHGIKMLADASMDGIDTAAFDAIVIPGGYPGYVNLGKDERVLRAVREMALAGKLTAAICCGPAVLMKAGVLQGRRATIHPSGVEKVSSCSEYSDARVVVDGKIITSRGPGTAMEFALRLVEALTGKEKAEETGRQVLAVC